MVEFGNLNIKNPVHKKLFAAVGEGKNNVDIECEDINDKDIVGLIRSGFGVSYNGMFGVYRIMWQ